MTTTPPRRYFGGQAPRAIAHRGFHPRGEENTLEAFGAALAAGAQVIETDTRATKDGVALTFHDATLARVAGIPTAVSSARWNELRGVHIAGIAPITRLDDALAAFPHTVFNIDVKDRLAIVPTVNAITRVGAAERVCLTSFDPNVARTAVRLLRKETGAAVKASASRDTVLAFRLCTAFEVPKRALARILGPYSALQIPPSFRGVPLVTHRTVAAAHAAGCEVHVWTIDESEQMRSLLAMGVDGIVSNRVDVAARECARFATAP